jgi:hypothetical protein
VDRVCISSKRKQYPVDRWKEIIPNFATSNVLKSGAPSLCPKKSNDDIQDSGR